MLLASRNWNLLVVDDSNCRAEYCVDEALREHLRRGNIKMIEGFGLGRGKKERDRGISVMQYTRWSAGHIHGHN